MSDRRVVRVSVSGDYLFDMMKRSWVVTRKGSRCIKGLPSDAVFVRSHYDGVEGVAYLYFKHPSFEWVPDGAVPPIFYITHGAINEFANPILRFLDFCISLLISWGVK